ncbi:MAG: von Willebrand factor type A domain-containing protein [bacterium]
MNNCHDIEPLLTSHLLGNLDPVRSDDVRKHLETCSDCRAAVEELELTLDLLRPALAVESSTAPARLDERRRERLKHWRIPGLLLWLTENPRPILQVAAAAACIALIATLFMPALRASKRKAEMARNIVDYRAIMSGTEQQAPAKPAMQVAMIDTFEAEHAGKRSYLEKSRPRAKAPEFPASAVVAAPESAPLPAEDTYGADLDMSIEQANLSGGAAGALGYAYAVDNKMEGAKTAPPGDALQPVSFEMTSGKDDVSDVAVAESISRAVGCAERPDRREKEVKVAESDAVIAITAPSARPEPVMLARNEEIVDVGAITAANDREGALVMKGLYAGRSSGGRAGARSQYADSYGIYTEQAVVKSLEWLKQNQRADGSWNHAEPGVASLGLLAYLAHGETTASEKYGETVEKALRYVLKRQDGDGRFSADPAEHALATYAISEAYGLTRIPTLKQAMNKGVAAVISDTLSGNAPGEWAAPALRASQLAGTDNTDLARAKESLSSNLRTSSEPTAAPSLQLLGDAKDPATRQKLDELAAETFDWNSSRSLEQWLGVHEALFRAGGQRWAKWNSATIKALLQQANEDGSWPARPDTASPFKGQAASTALSALMMQVYYRFLPTFKPVATEPDTPAATNDDVTIRIKDALASAREEPPAKPVFRAYGSNPYIEVLSNRFSTFSIDVDTASYTLGRKYMQNGSLPPAEAVRTEEFVNFFNYGYTRPGKDVFTISTEAAPSAFGPGHLLKIGVVGRNVSANGRHEAVLTLVIDTSGSMDTPDRLGLARQALRLLLDQLSPNDRVAIVQYDSHARLVLEHTPVAERETIRTALDGLQTSGSTHLEEGLMLGYDVAAAAFKPGAINRVLFFSDGVANLGSANAEDILAAVAEAREKGILCSVFGFGTGTYDDTMLETLANRGDGTYQFIDSLNEAKRIFVDNLSATLDVVATDVKIQVEWNPARVARFRQLGYENRQLKTEDFRNDAVDAGEVGASQAVTALYEMDLAGDEAAPLGTVRVRYRDAISGQVFEIERKILPAGLRPQFDSAAARFKLAACVAEFAEILRVSPFADGSSFEDVARVLRPVALELGTDPQVQELLSLVHSASSLPRANQ